MVLIPLHVPGTPGDPIQLPTPGTLIFEVMDGEHRADLGVLMHPHRNHAGVPVVAVKHLRLPNVPGKLRCSTGKKRESPVLVLHSIDPLGIKKRMPHQINDGVVCWVLGLVHRNSVPIVWARQIGSSGMRSLLQSLL